MQIRIANRQDEAPVRAFFEKQGKTLDLIGADKDLHNIDQGYFGHDGLFVVAEEDGEIIGLAGARQSSDSADVLELIRLAVSAEQKSDSTTGGAIKERMLAIIKNHAYQMDFKTIKVKDELAALVS